MQTFLPYPDFAASARVLDRQRLGKQRVETKQILNALLQPGKGWGNHPAAHMWRGFESALVLYGDAMVVEWRARGYDNTMDFEREAHSHGIEYRLDPDLPPWLGNPAFHASHRSNLLRKAPDHYRQFWPDEPDDLPYVWPV